MEFKIDAVELVEKQGYTIPTAAKSLGIPQANITKWRRHFLRLPRGTPGLIHLYETPAEYPEQTIVIGILRSPTSMRSAPSSR